MYLFIQLSILAFSVNFLGKIELNLLSKSTWQLAVVKNDIDTILGKGLNCLGFSNQRERSQTTILATN